MAITLCSGCFAFHENARDEADVPERHVRSSTICLPRAAVPELARVLEPGIVEGACLLQTSHRDATTPFRRDSLDVRYERHGHLVERYESVGYAEQGLWEGDLVPSPSTLVETLEVDPEGRLLREEVPGGTTLEHSYAGPRYAGAAWRRGGVVEQRLEHAYEGGLLARTTTWAGGEAADELRFDYDASGRLVHEEADDGTSEGRRVDWSYDDDGLPEAVHYEAAGLVLDIAFQYDERGELSGRTYEATLSPVGETDYRYVIAGPLDDYESALLGTRALGSFSYPAIAHEEGCQPLPVSLSFGYDEPYYALGHGVALSAEVEGMLHPITAVARRVAMDPGSIEGTSVRVESRYAHGTLAEETRVERNESDGIVRTIVRTRELDAADRLVTERVETTAAGGATTARTARFEWGEGGHLVSRTLETEGATYDEHIGRRDDLVRSYVLRTTAGDPERGGASTEAVMEFHYDDQARVTNASASVTPSDGSEPTLGTLIVTYDPTPRMETLVTGPSRREARRFVLGAEERLEGLEIDEEADGTLETRITNVFNADGALVEAQGHHGDDGWNEHREYTCE